MELRSKVGPDGVLKLTVPVGLSEANQEVIITVESVHAEAADDEEWRRAVQATAGSIQDPTFVRHEQGEYEPRNTWE